MNTLTNDLSLAGEGLRWVQQKPAIEETELLAQEAKLHSEIKQLFYPETNFVAPGVDRKNSEDEDYEDNDSCESSDAEMDDVSGFSGFVP